VKSASQFAAAPPVSSDLLPRKEQMTSCDGEATDGWPHLVARRAREILTVRRSRMWPASAAHGSGTHEAAATRMCTGARLHADGRKSFSDSRKGLADLADAVDAREPILH